MNERRIIDMEFYVIRHGQTATNACKGMVGRKQEYSLTEKGEEQAKKKRVRLLIH